MRVMSRRSTRTPQRPCQGDSCGCARRNRREHTEVQTIAPQQHIAHCQWHTFAQPPCHCQPSHGAMRKRGHCQPQGGDRQPHARSLHNSTTGRTACSHVHPPTSGGTKRANQSPQAPPPPNPVTHTPRWQNFSPSSALFFCHQSFPTIPTSRLVAPATTPSATRSPPHCTVAHNLLSPRARVIPILTAHTPRW